MNEGTATSGVSASSVFSAGCSVSSGIGMIRKAAEMKMAAPSSLYLSLASKGVTTNDVEFPLYSRITEHCERLVTVQLAVVNFIVFQRKNFARGFAFSIGIGVATAIAVSLIRI